MEAMCGKFNHWKSYTESVIQGRPLGSLDKVLYRIRARKSSYVCVRKTYGGPHPMEFMYEVLYRIRASESSYICDL